MCSYFIGKMLDPRKQTQMSQRMSNIIGRSFKLLAIDMVYHNVSERISNQTARCCFLSHGSLIVKLIFNFDQIVCIIHTHI